MEMTKLFIENLQQEQLCELLLDRLTEEEYNLKMKRWPEKTSTSPSQIHLGHHKAPYARHGLEKDSDRATALEAIQRNVKSARVKLINFTITEGYSFDRWQNVINTMILKEPNNFKIHRLRVIHIYEADYNLFLAIMWRKLVRLADKHERLPRTQYGGVPGKCAHDPVYMEETEWDITRCSRKPLVQIDYDAAS